MRALAEASVEAQLLVGVTPKKRLWLQGLVLARELLPSRCFPCWHLFPFVMGRNKPEGLQPVITQSPVGKYNVKFAGAC